jgi:transposase
VKVTQAYRFALDPTPAQERALRSHAGASRFAWNWGLAKCTERYEVEGRWYSGAELHKLWNAEKKADPALAWWGENSKCAYQESFRDLDRALKDFIRSRKGTRKGKRLGFPRFKKRGKCRDSFRFSTGAVGCGRVSVTLPRLGVIRTHESARKLAQVITASRWYPSSKTCSACGRRKPSLTLAERTFTCEACGLVMDRDENAARNLLKLAVSGTREHKRLRSSVRPGPAGHLALKQEPGSPDGRQTGTSPRQHGDAA